MIAFYLLVSVMPMIRHPLWSDLIGDITVMKYVGLASLVYAVIYLPQRRTAAEFFTTPQSKLFMVFAFLMIGSFLAMGDPYLPIEISPLASFVSFILFFFVTLIVVDSPERLRWVLLTAVGSVAFASLHTIREWTNVGMMAGYRPGYVTGDPNYYSISTLLCLPVPIYLMRTTQPKWERMFCMGTLALCLFGLTLAASRGGFIGLVAGAIVMALHSKRRMRTLVTIIILTLPLMLIAPSSPLSRLFNPDHGDQASADHRMELINAGLAMFRAYPLTGIGPGNFKAVLPQFAELEELHIAHNTFVELMAETGVPGITIFLITMAATLISLERTRRRATDELIVQTAAALQVGLVAFLGAAFFVSAEAHRFVWLVVFLTSVLPAMATEPSEAPVPAPRRLPPGETVRRTPSPQVP